MKRFHINVTSSQPNFSVVIPLINPCFVNTNPPENANVELSKINWSKTCPQYPDINDLPQFQQQSQPTQPQSQQLALPQTQQIHQTQTLPTMPTFLPSYPTFDEEDQDIATPAETKTITTSASAPNLNEIKNNYIDNTKKSSSMDNMNEIDNTSNETNTINETAANDDNTTNDDNETQSANETNETDSTITTEELLKACHDEILECARTLKRVRESKNEIKDIKTTHRILEIIRSHIGIINTILTK